MFFFVRKQVGLFSLPPSLSLKERNHLLFNSSPSATAQIRNSTEEAKFFANPHNKDKTWDTDIYHNQLLSTQWIKMLTLKWSILSLSYTHTHTHTDLKKKRKRLCKCQLIPNNVVDMLLSTNPQNNAYQRFILFGKFKFYNLSNRTILVDMECQVSRCLNLKSQS